MFIINDKKNLEDLLQIKVGKRIQQIRIEKKLSQQDLAAKCNFEKSNMSRLESGGANATLSTLSIVSKALDVEPVELFKF
ncbi:conserved hypothetical protein [Flavobacterium psychrophilum]|nr:conserved hypothetical protein [Flavobacterium psychrophilum]